MEPEMPNTSRGLKRTWSSALKILSKMEIDSNSLSSISEMEIESKDEIEVPPFSDTDFVWETADESFEARAPNFDVGAAGFTADFLPPEESKELEYFLAFFDHEIISIALRESNAFYQQFVSEGLVKNSTKQKSFVDLTSEELYSFLALVLAMSHCKKQALLIDYWAVDEIIDTPRFQKYMTRQRFGQILRFLHFEDNNNASDQDRFWKIRNIFTKLVAKFSKFYKLNQNLGIDESLALFKVRLFFQAVHSFQKTKIWDKTLCSL